MRFFANTAINRIYLHSAAQGFAENTGGIFVFVYLLKQGFGAPGVLCSIAAVVLSRLVLRQAVLPLAIRFGLRFCLAFGTGLVALAYLVLAQVHAVGPAFFAYLFLAALGEAFYWTSYHAATAALGDAEARGAQVSAVQLLYAVNAVVGPALGGLSLMWLGPLAGFALAAAAQALAVLPLLALPRLPVAAQDRSDPRAATFARRAYFMDGVMNSGVSYAWSLALFATLGENFQSYGLAQALAALGGAVMALGIGQLFDLGHHAWSTGLALAAMGLSIVAKALGFGLLATALPALALGALANPLYGAAFNARIYNLAQASHDPLRFHVRGEGGWDMGTALGCCFSAGLLHWGASPFWTILVGLAGLGGVALLLRQGAQLAQRWAKRALIN